MKLSRTITHRRVEQAGQRSADSVRETQHGLPPQARVQAYLLAGAALVGLVCLALPHPSSYNEPGLLVVAVVILIVAGILEQVAERVPPVVTALMPAAASGAATATVMLSGDSTSAFVLFYLWIGLYCVYLLPWRQAAVQLSLAGAAFVVAVVVTPQPTGAVPHEEAQYLAMSVGTMAIVGSLLVHLRTRLGELVGSLSRASRTDLLTELLNLRGVSETLETEIGRGKRIGSRLSLLLVDVDRLKEVNERLGRADADLLLKRVAEVLVDEIRGMDTIGRSGASEFTLVLPETDEHDAHLVAERLLARVRRTFRGEPVPLTTSIGVANFPKHASSAEQLLKAADDAVYAAKVLGRDRAVLFSPKVPEIIGGQAALRPADTHLATMLSLAEAVDLRERGSAAHSQAVADYAELMARELGLPVQRIERVRLAGLLHDIGKVGVPDSVLQKSDPLNEGDWEELRRHPEIGARILGSREFADLREWVLASHERPDGSGYPRGLAGAAIPLEARILAVADSYEAMTADHAYRPALSSGKAREELRHGMGTQFDPAVVEAFLSALDRDDLRARGGFRAGISRPAGTSTK
jgi:diguanylate cyclase (GGDEF)-like protein/putative nucleotidyltransferase with HDIG domain